MLEIARLQDTSEVHKQIESRLFPKVSKLLEDAMIINNNKTTAKNVLEQKTFQTKNLKINIYEIKYITVV